MQKSILNPDLIRILILFLCLSALSATPQKLHAENEAAGNDEPVEIKPGDLPDEADLHELGIEIEEGEDERLTFNLRNAPLEDFFALVAAKTGLRFVVKPEIEEIEVTTFLPDVRVSAALDAVLTIYGLEAREIESGILLIDDLEVRPFDPIIDAETELITLKYLDAEDVKETIDPFLSEHGKIVIVERSGYTDAAEGGTGSRRRKVESRSIIVREKPEVLEILKPLIESMDVRSQQILISAHIVEARHEAIRDLGIDWHSERRDLSANIELGARAAPVDAQPGLGMHFRRIAGRDEGELQAFLRILEEKAGGNILSSPRILVMDNQQCTILEGERFPILLADIDTETGRRTYSLDRYEDVGVQLDVIPRIQHNNTINMIINPSVSTKVDEVEARDEEVVLTTYPVIGTRETQTQISIEDGHTIVIGGLIKENSFDTTRGVPFLQDIPLLGRAFRREVEETEKVDLLIFLSAEIVAAPDESTEERLRKMGEGVVHVYENEITTRAYPEEGGTAQDLTDAAPYNINETAELKATPGTGYKFIEWTGNTHLITEGSNTEKEITLTMREDDAWLTANFELIDYTLEVNAKPEDYGAALDRTGAEYYNTGDKARLRAIPEEGYEFIEWTGDAEYVEDTEAADTTLTVYDADVELNAVFEPADYMLIFRTEPEGERIEKGAFNLGDSVALEAEPSPGYRFRRWSGNTRHITEGSRTDHSITVTFPAGDLELVAHFEEIDYDLPE